MNSIMYKVLCIMGTAFFAFYILHSTFYIPTFAAVDLGDKYGFGDIPTLGEGVNRLVTPTFSIATAVVVIYFLAGAFKYLTSAGDKEAVAGARGMITHAIIGFMILIFAFLVLQFGLSLLFGIEGLQIFDTQKGTP